jgi:hypothetical protein
MTYDSSTATLPPLAWEAVKPLLDAHFRRTQRRTDRQQPPLAGAPQRFGDSYRWPDGSWTQVG